MQVKRDAMRLMGESSGLDLARILGDQLHEPGFSFVSQEIEIGARQRAG